MAAVPRRGPEGAGLQPAPLRAADRPAPAARPGLWYLVLLVLPLVIVVIFSFGTRAKNGGYEPGFVLDNYVRAIDKSDPFVTSLQMAVGGHHRVPARRPAARLLHGHAGRTPEGPLRAPPGRPVLDELPHPDLRLAIILGPNAGLAGQIESITGDHLRILGSRSRSSSASSTATCR